MAKITKSSIQTIISKASKEQTITEEMYENITTSLLDIVLKTKKSNSFFNTPRIDKKRIVLSVRNKYERSWEIICIANITPTFIDLDFYDYFKLILEIKIVSNGCIYKNEFILEFKVPYLDYIYENPKIGKRALGKRICRKIFNIKKLANNSTIYVKDCIFCKEAEKIINYFDRKIFDNRAFEEIDIKTYVPLIEVREFTAELIDVVENSFSETLVNFYAETEDNYREAVKTAKKYIGEIYNNSKLYNKPEEFLKESLKKGISKENRRLFKKIIERAIEIKEELMNEYFEIDLDEFTTEELEYYNSLIKK